MHHAFKQLQPCKLQGQRGSYQNARLRPNRKSLPSHEIVTLSQLNLSAGLLLVFSPNRLFGSCQVSSGTSYPSDLVCTTPQTITNPMLPWCFRFGIDPLAIFFYHFQEYGKDNFCSTKILMFSFYFQLFHLLHSDGCYNIGPLCLLCTFIALMFSCWCFLIAFCYSKYSRMKAAFNTFFASILGLPMSIGITTIHSTELLVLRDGRDQPHPILKPFPFLQITLIFIKQRSFNVALFNSQPFLTQMLNLFPLFFFTSIFLPRILQQFTSPGTNIIFKLYLYYFVFLYHTKQIHSFTLFCKINFKFSKYIQHNTLVRCIFFLCGFIFVF